MKGNKLKYNIKLNTWKVKIIKNASINNDPSQNLVQHKY